MSTDAFAISDAHVDEVFATSPLQATAFGIPGSDHRWDDFSPAGAEQWADLWRRTRTALLPHRDAADPDQSHAARVLVAKLDEQLAAHEAGDHLRDLNHVHCPFTEVRDIFDLMDRSSPAAFDDVRRRLATVEAPLAGYRERLALGMQRNLVPARRQVASIIEQARVVAGDQSSWLGYPDEARAVGVDQDGLAALDDAIGHARVAVAAFADWLEAELLPAATPDDPVGRERYLRAVDAFVGAELDLDETYEWGWHELARIWDEMRAEAARIDPDADIREVIEQLETDPAAAAESPEAFAAFVQARLDDAVARLDGTWFDLPDKMKEVTVNIAPPGGALGAWYINPSEDFTRPGSVWYSLGSQTTVPLWREVSTAYHEGFPGHHLQVATVMDRRERLSRAHRLLVWYPGYGEGWALYTERLMDELGFLETPAYRLGMLSTQAFRAARVVVDIGSHLELAIPDDAPLHPGRDWSFERGVDYMHRMGLEPLEVAESEVKRYLGWPAQAITYKVGERAILDLRAELQARGDFDLNTFHDRILDGGPLRLDMLRARMLDGGAGGAPARSPS